MYWDYPPNIRIAWAANMGLFPRDEIPMRAFENPTTQRFRSRAPATVSSPPDARNEHTQRTETLSANSESGVGAVMAERVVA